MRELGKFAQPLAWADKRARDEKGARRRMHTLYASQEHARHTAAVSCAALRRAVHVRLQPGREAHPRNDAGGTPRVRGDGACHATAADLAQRRAGVSTVVFASRAEHATGDPVTGLVVHDERLSREARPHALHDKVEVSSAIRVRARVLDAAPRVVGAGVLVPALVIRVARSPRVHMGS